MVIQRGLPTFQKMYASSLLSIYVNNNRAISFGDAAGTLHGNWVHENALSSSDKRLKRDIEPLHDTLRRLQEGFSSQSESATAAAASTSPADWVLRELRPVSFRPKNDPSGPRRFGFIADELEKVLPSIVVMDNDEARMRRVRMLDFIALIVEGMQSHQRMLLTLGEKQEEKAAQQLKVEERLDRIEHVLERLSARVDSCCVAAPPSECVVV
eukprot:gnl/TRDRNA2_/TRDRNA2_139968_c0_seq3.p1 gnl/TRDRNA2_/TRDRNA2_139968_c0~~gnl/TRDRNA2_/TRDRNA2_139968_c0_seq3.p1  ORF type:complete len:212 (+),score=43.50 gnl/TRDRNA2_/TRDRNA2_139968_c0_seq3:337-972(+)